MSQVPVHVAIIMDGNGRWAQARGLKRSDGHKAGAEPVRGVLKAAKKSGVKFLTLYAFSTENWGRPEEEVRGLFKLLCHYLESEKEELLSGGVRLEAIGDIQSLPLSAQQALKTVKDLTVDGHDITLNLALSYGSRAELANAARLLAQEVNEGLIESSDINEDMLAEKLWTHGIPEPDLLIRTGGDMRLSNFLLWQCAYTELYFTKTLWPDFTEKDFAEALESFAGRQRRYGLC